MLDPDKGQTTTKEDLDSSTLNSMCYNLGDSVEFDIDTSKKNSAKNVIESSRVPFLFSKHFSLDLFHALKGQILPNRSLYFSREKEVLFPKHSCLFFLSPRPCLVCYNKTETNLLDKLDIYVGTKLIDTRCNLIRICLRDNFSAKK